MGRQIPEGGYHQFDVAEVNPLVIVPGRLNPAEAFSIDMKTMAELLVGTETVGTGELHELLTAASYKLDILQAMGLVNAMHIFGLLELREGSSREIARSPFWVRHGARTFD